MSYLQKELNFQMSIAKIETEKTKALDERKIEIPEFRQINGEQLVLENMLNQFNIALANDTFTSLEVPGSKLQQSIDKLEEAIDTIERVRRFLKSVADVVDELNKIVGSILRLAAL